MPRAWKKPVWVGSRPVGPASSATSFGARAPALAPAVTWRRPQRVRRRRGGGRSEAEQEEGVERGRCSEVHGNGTEMPLKL
eukprot:3083792-Rhodomonas_salina.1